MNSLELGSPRGNPYGPSVAQTDCKTHREGIVMSLQGQKDLTDGLISILDNVEEGYLRACDAARDVTPSSLRSHHAKNVGEAIKDFLNEDGPHENLARLIWDDHMSNINWTDVGEHYLSTSGES